MRPCRRNSFKYSSIVGDGFVETDLPPVVDILSSLTREGAWREAYIYPEEGMFPRCSVSFHEGHGLVVQCYENEESWSDFLSTADTLSSPQVYMELGGQALERWPRELFVPEDLAAEALEWFLESGRQKPSLCWIRIDAFPRETVWERREGRVAWERLRGHLGRSGE